MEKKNVLIIEDDFYVSRAYAIKLEKESIGSQTINDGEMAIDFINKNKPLDAIVLDLMLPKKNGFEVLKEIKQNSQWKNVPVIILSNLGQEDDIKKGKELGAVEYIIKADTSIEEVINKIKKFL